MSVTKIIKLCMIIHDDLIYHLFGNDVYPRVEWLYLIHFFSSIGKMNSTNFQYDLYNRIFASLSNRKKDIVGHILYDY